MAAGIGVAASVEDACLWLLAVVIHEVGHGLMAWARGSSKRIDVQLGAGDAYTGGRFDPWVLAAGPGASLAAWSALLYGWPEQAAVRGWILQWTLFQAWPFPTSDGGVALRGLWVRAGGSERSGFVAVGILGAVAAGAALAWIGPQHVWAVWWVGLAVLVAFTEWPAVLHLDAYRHFEAGRLEQVVRLASGRSGARFESLRRLGIQAAVVTGDSDRLATLVAESASVPEVWVGIRKLLEVGHPEGRRQAERVLDGYAGREEGLTPPIRQGMAELAATFAVEEARRGAHASALGLLETAKGYGFDRFDWLEFEPELQPLRTHPRWAALLGSPPHAS